MRIISGAWRGRALAAPKGTNTRPTSDRAREALFSMLLSRLGGFDDLNVLDLYAGTGALGLETLSRGAAHCTFVESDSDALNALRANIKKMDAAANTAVLAQPVENLITKRQTPADLVLLDPPYDSGLGQRALTRLAAKGWIAPGAWVALETAHNEKVDITGFSTDAVRDHGKARLHLMRYDPPDKA